jgi:hypothetical protein
VRTFRIFAWLPSTGHPFMSPRKPLDPEGGLRCTLADDPAEQRATALHHATVNTQKFIAARSVRRSGPVGFQPNRACVQALDAVISSAAKGAIQPK